MHIILPFLLAMVVAIVLLEMLADKLRIAYPILLVSAGLLISFIPGLPAFKINPDFIFFIFLPPLLFEASWASSFNEMKKWWRMISSFVYGKGRLTTSEAFYELMLIRLADLAGRVIAAKSKQY